MCLREVLRNARQVEDFHLNRLKIITMYHNEEKQYRTNTFRFRSIPQLTANSHLATKKLTRRQPTRHPL